MRPPRSPELLLRRVWEHGAPRPVAAALAAASWAYRAALVARETGYAVGALRTGRLPCPVVSIGNITLGGSGKTPLTEVVVRELIGLGSAPAVVSRGYGRRTRGVLVVSDGRSIKADARDAGDEPLLLAERLPGVPVVVGENRLAAGRVAMDACGATAVVLDDGFQHRVVAKDLEVVAVNGEAPWGNGRLFPRGTLREPPAALGRADLVVVTHAHEAGAVERVAAAVRRHNPRAPVLAAALVPLGAEDKASGRRASPAELAGRRLVAVSGLGWPVGFVATLGRLGVDTADTVEFPDHHWYSAADLADLARHARAVGAEGLITTEKDWMRLRGLRLPMPLWVLATELRVVSGHEMLVAALAPLARPATAPRA